MRGSLCSGMRAAGRWADMGRVPVPPGRYLLLGASGLIGSHLLRRLFDAPDVSVCAVTRERPLPAWAREVEHHRLDLTLPDALGSLVSGVDAVFHAAGEVLSAPVLARDPIGGIQRNVLISQAIFAQARAAGVPRVVWMSTTTGYPESDRPLVEADFFRGAPPAAWARLGAAARYLERLARLLAGRPRASGRAAGRAGSGTSFIALRPSLVYGPGDDFSVQSGHFLPALARRVVGRERPIEVWGDGSDRRDLIYAGDVAEAALRALAIERPVEALNICAGQSTSVREVLDLLLELDGFSDPEIEFMAGRPRTSALREFDPCHASHILGPFARTPLRTGLLKTIESLSENP